jgi:hypothetical protein
MLRLQTELHRILLVFVRLKGEEFGQQRVGVAKLAERPAFFISRIKLNERVFPKTLLFLEEIFDLAANAFIADAKKTFDVALGLLLQPVGTTD